MRHTHIDREGRLGQRADAERHSTAFAVLVGVVVAARDAVLGIISPGATNVRYAKNGIASR